MSETYRHVSAVMTGAPDGGLLGAVIAEYRLLRLLGRGGMGRVFEGEHVHSGCRAAIKLVHAELSGNEQVAARFVNESRAAIRVEHPGVVRVYEAGQTSDGYSYIIMEYLDGVLLAQRLSEWYGAEREQPSLTPSRRAPSVGEQAIHIAWQIADTLSAVHSHGIIHRDLKPENIFLVRGEGDRERAKIFDFGIAKLLQNPAPARDDMGGGVGGARDSVDLPSPQTKIGTVLGTPIYMSPEQWQGHGQITDRADVYAAGGIFFELFTGFPPFRSQVLGQLLLSHMHQPPPRLETEAPWLPAPLAEIVGRMLAKEPSARPSMEEVAEALERHLSQTRVQAAPALLSIASSGSSRSDGAAAQAKPESPAELLPPGLPARVSDTNLTPLRAPESAPARRHSSVPPAGPPVDGNAAASDAQETLIAALSPSAELQLIRRARPSAVGQRQTRLVPAHRTIISGPLPSIPPQRPLPMARIPAPPGSLNLVAVCALGLFLTSVVAFLLQGK